MSSKEKRQWLKRLLQPVSPNQAVKPDLHHPLTNEYQQIPGVEYALFGADHQKDIPPLCPFCGGKYEGPVQSNCLYCGTTRKAYLIEKLGTAPQPISPSDPKPTILAPEALSATVGVGNDGVRAWIQAKQVDLALSARVGLIEADIVKTGWHVKVDTIIAHELLKAGHNFQANIGIVSELVVASTDTASFKLLVAKGINQIAHHNNSPTGRIIVGGDLFLQSEGVAVFGPESQITNLYIGPRCQGIILQSGSRVDHAYTTGPGGEISSGNKAQVLNETRITLDKYTGLLLSAIKAANAQRTSVSAPK